jgi:hypothetical protein
MAMHRGPVELFWQASSGAAEILAQTSFFQPTTQLDALVGASRSHRVVVLRGEAGAGESSLAAALDRPKIAVGRVPDVFEHAIAIPTPAPTAGDEPEAVALMQTEPAKRAAAGLSGRWRENPRLDMPGNHVAVFRVLRQSAFLRDITLNAPDHSEVLDPSNDTPQIE